MNLELNLCCFVLAAQGSFKARRPDFVAKAELFNSTLKRLCLSLAMPNIHMSVLKHQHITSMLLLLLCDGVHLNDMEKLLYFYTPGNRGGIKITG